jgi:arylesterase/paraoxonase
MLRFIGWLFLLLLVAAGVWGYFFLEAAGVFLKLEPKSVGVCTPVTAGGVVGIEDLTIDPETKLAYLSGYDRRGALAGQQVRGAIWVYSVSAPDGAPIDATTAALPGGFWPHGVSLFRGADGKRTLFVINHAGRKHSVEIFDVDGATLAHRRTVTGPELVSPNDIVGVGPDSFYVTNDHANVAGWMRTVEDYGRLRLTVVQFFDGQKFSSVLSGIGGSNGINVSADGRTLYVSAASERTVYVYDRDPQTNALVQRASVAVPGFADNIEVLGNGDLLLGLHSKILDLVAHLGDAKKLSPSHIMLLKADGKGSFVPETIYYDLGEGISGASVGASVDKRLLVGAIFEPKVLNCSWDAAP